MEATQPESPPAQLVWIARDAALVEAGRIGVEEPALVGEDDGLHAVAEVQLLQDVGDVRLDRRLADVELLADLRVREPGGDEPQDLALARGELVDALRALGSVEP